MKAVVYDKSNTPDAFVMREVEKPSPKDNEVLVKIFAVSINAADYRSMRMGIIPKRKIFGADIAGQVEAVGKDARDFKVGDDVFGDISSIGFGGFAEYAAVPVTLLARKPAGVTYPQAAAIPMASLTALQALRDQGMVRSGNSVLVYGAGGGVGSFAVQLAKHFGAVVTAVCGPKSVEMVRSLGADRVVDYVEEDILASGQQFDLILGVTGSHGLSEYRRALTAHGTFVLVGGALSQVIKTLIFHSLLSLGGRKMRFPAAKADAKDLEFVMRLVEDGTVKVVIDHQYSLEQTAEAMRYCSQGHTHGKVVISVAD
jgi:NADPH:quinone reductase-like Zn-dependent oxidoreductase